jgi:putative transposase
VFVTKRQGKIFTEPHLQVLESTFRKVCQDFSVDLKAFNGETDHVHLLVEYPPKVCISVLVNSLKGVSSRRLKQQFPEINRHWAVRKSENALWSPSYFVGSVGGAPIEVLKQYIEDQQRPH